MNYGYGNMGLGLNNMGFQQPVRYSRRDILEYLKMYIQNTTGVMVQSETPIWESNRFVRHACLNHSSGVVAVNQETFPVPEMGVTVPFYFCKCCGKLYYLKDFM